VSFVLAANLLHSWLKAMGVGLSTVGLKSFGQSVRFKIGVIPWPQK